MIGCSQCEESFETDKIMELPTGPVCVGCYGLLERYVDELMEDDDLWP